METPKTEKLIRSFIGKIQYISRFISKLSITCEPIFRLLKKNQPKKWNKECQEAFEKIKTYLTNPPVLCPPWKRLYTILSDNKEKREWE